MEIKGSGVINVKIASLLKGVDSVWTSGIMKLECCKWLRALLPTQCTIHHSLRGRFVLKSQGLRGSLYIWGQDATRSPFTGWCPKHREKGHWWGRHPDLHLILVLLSPSPETSSELLSLSVLAFPHLQKRKKKNTDKATLSPLVPSSPQPSCPQTFASLCLQ